MDTQPHELQARKTQQGFALIMLAFVLGLIATAVILGYFSPAALKGAQEQKTAQSLMLAKTALIAYAATRDLNATCTNNCNRPGDLPCPDTNNNGFADASCDTQAKSLGRLPYKTLGLDDIRDGSGERLWYAVSVNFKDDPRGAVPLNSDAPGTIAVLDSEGNVINNGQDMTGAIAVILAPGAPLTRTDNWVQTRDLTNENNPKNYLDIAEGEDNATFIEASAKHGFVMGDVNTGGGGSFNDRLAVITHDDLFPVIEARVVAEVSNALQTYNSTNFFYPSPADFSDPSCLGSSDIAGCASVPSLTRGRIPAHPTIAWDGSSKLGGNVTGNWFQQNAWREVIYYGVSSLCYEGTTNCTQGNLTLQNAQVAPTDNKKVVIIATGRTIGTQSHSTKTSEADYLEGENASADDTYVRTVPLNSTINDFAISIP